MNSDEGASETQAPASPSGRRRFIDTILWVVLPIGAAIGLAVKYWPQ